MLVYGAGVAFHWVRPTVPGTQTLIEAPTQSEGTSPTSKSVSTSLILRGVLAVIVGIIALAWPSATILALVILFAIYAFMDAGFEAVRAFNSGKAGPVVGHLLLALLDLAAGVIALVWPAPTALALVLVVGIWAFVGGFLEIFSAFDSGETAGTRAMYIVTGLVWIEFGVVLFARPGVGAVTLALLFGLFNLIAGATLITRGIEVRKTGRTLHSVLPEAA
jgi:uncharacterized membrane protein HdeD (DUF308 family)